MKRTAILTLACAVLPQLNGAAHGAAAARRPMGSPREVVMETGVLRPNPAGETWRVVLRDLSWSKAGAKSRFGRFFGQIFPNGGQGCVALANVLADKGYTPGQFEDKDRSDADKIEVLEKEIIPAVAARMEEKAKKLIDWAYDGRADEDALDQLGGGRSALDQDYGPIKEMKQVYGAYLKPGTIMALTVAKAYAGARSEALRASAIGIFADGRQAPGAVPVVASRRSKRGGDQAGAGSLKKGPKGDSYRRAVSSKIVATPVGETEVILIKFRKGVQADAALRLLDDLGVDPMRSSTYRAGGGDGYYYAGISMADAKAAKMAPMLAQNWLVKSVEVNHGAYQRLQSAAGRRRNGFIAPVTERLVVGVALPVLLGSVLSTLGHLPVVKSYLIGAGVGLLPALYCFYKLIQSDKNEDHENDGLEVPVAAYLISGLLIAGGSALALVIALLNYAPSAGR